MHRCPLANHPLYRGRDVDEAREVLSSLFLPVSIDPLRTGTPFRASVNGLRLPRSTICYCEYDHGMVAKTAAPIDFHAIQLTMAGAARFDTPSGVLGGNPKTGVVLSADQQVNVRHDQKNAVLSFIVKQDILQELVSAWTDDGGNRPLQFQPLFAPNAPRIASVVSLLETIVGEMDRSGGVLESATAVASAEQALLTFLLFGLDHNLSDALKKPAAEPGDKQVREVEEYIEAHASEPIGLETLAGVTGHSASSIHRAFRRHRDCSPMAYLREVRIRLARRQLLSHDPTQSVTSVAFQCGFTHLGRFASLYKRHFGESPSETLTRVSQRR